MKEISAVNTNKPKAAASHVAIIPLQSILYDR